VGTVQEVMEGGAGEGLDMAHFRGKLKVRNNSGKLFQEGNWVRERGKVVFFLFPLTLYLLPQSQNLYLTVQK